MLLAPAGVGAEADPVRATRGHAIDHRLGGSRGLRGRAPATPAAACSSARARPHRATAAAACARCVGPLVTHLLLPQEDSVGDLGLFLIVLLLHRQPYLPRQPLRLWVLLLGITPVLAALARATLLQGCLFDVPAKRSRAELLVGHLFQRVQATDAARPVAQGEVQQVCRRDRGALARDPPRMHPQRQLLHALRGRCLQDEEHEEALGGHPGIPR
mmetsp:Transcript_17634/g.61687  ORF Transcript_17634/g.61687 Transcript_17634/m.61687 type:complete len:215 (+) Transcript_17634:371-1015(+)